MIRVYVKPKAPHNIIKIEEYRPLREYKQFLLRGYCEKAVVEMLARKRGIAKRKVSIISGQTSRKSIVVDDMEPAFAASILLDKRKDV
ncbi:MAG: hypothetical protein COA73_08710 [Candidatus Hydrogenedentota bacterium]|nr:MAG: hypothetical protein COA73_14830 [Candidatus Hydrogenedentota bacterium]PCJ59792.1 MAG: hypothetical protein COA73_08710 [Candidatus Hydrogenedentota bacterium]